MRSDETGCRTELQAADLLIESDKFFDTKILTRVCRAARAMIGEQESETNQALRLCTALVVSEGVPFLHFVTLH